MTLYRYYVIARENSLFCSFHIFEAVLNLAAHGEVSYRSCDED